MRICVLFSLATCGSCLVESVSPEMTESMVEAALTSDKELANLKKFAGVLTVMKQSEAYTLQAMDQYNAALDMLNGREHILADREAAINDAKKTINARIPQLSALTGQVKEMHKKVNTAVEANHHTEKKMQEGPIPLQKRVQALHALQEKEEAALYKQATAVERSMYSHEMVRNAAENQLAKLKGMDTALDGDLAEIQTKQTTMQKMMAETKEQLEFWLNPENQDFYAYELSQSEHQLNAAGMLEKEKQVSSKWAKIFSSLQEHLRDRHALAKTVNAERQMQLDYRTKSHGQNLQGLKKMLNHTMTLKKTLDENLKKTGAEMLTHDGPAEYLFDVFGKKKALMRFLEEASKPLHTLMDASTAKLRKLEDEFESLYSANTHKLGKKAVETADLLRQRVLLEVQVQDAKDEVAEQANSMNSLNDQLWALDTMLKQDEVSPTTVDFWHTIKGAAEPAQVRALRASVGQHRAAEAEESNMDGELEKLDEMAEQQLEPTKIDLMKEVEEWVERLAEKKDQVTGKRLEFFSGLQYQTRSLADLQRQAPRSLQKVHELKRRLTALEEDYEDAMVEQEALKHIEETAPSFGTEVLVNEASLSEWYKSAMNSLHTCNRNSKILAQQMESIEDLPAVNYSAHRSLWSTIQTKKAKIESNMRVLEQMVKDSNAMDNNLLVEAQKRKAIVEDFKVKIEDELSRATNPKVMAVLNGTSGLSDPQVAGPFQMADEEAAKAVSEMWAQAKENQRAYGSQFRQFVNFASRVKTGREDAMSQSKSDMLEMKKYSALLNKTNEEYFTAVEKIADEVQESLNDTHRFAAFQLKQLREDFNFLKEFRNVDMKMRFEMDDRLRSVYTEQKMVADHEPKIDEEAKKHMTALVSLKQEMKSLEKTMEEQNSHLAAKTQEVNAAFELAKKLLTQEKEWDAKAQWMDKVRKAMKEERLGDLEIFKTVAK